MENEEPIPSVTGEVPVERVIIGDEVKLYYAKAILFRLPLKGPYDCADTVVQMSASPLPVRNSDRVVIGYATLEVAGRDIVADIAIRYDSEERLFAETKSQDIWARAEGEVLCRPTALIDLDRPASVRQIRIDYIRLTDSCPRDNTIRPFGSFKPYEVLTP